MPLEHRPRHPLTEGPRPGSRMPPHKVTDDETLESIARKFGVDMRQLCMHNFGTLDSREINWYLRHRVGCKLQTHDGKNWRFSKAADPGLIYIPMLVIQLDPVTIVGGVPAPVHLHVESPIRNFMPSQSFAHEFKIPPEPLELKYWLLQAFVKIEGEIKQEHGALKIAVKKDQVKIEIEKQISQDWKAAFGYKFDDESIQAVADAVKKGSLKDVGAAIAKPVEGVLKKSRSFGNFSTEVQFGAQVSKMPVILKSAGAYENNLILEGLPFKGKFKITIAFNIGLTKAGWTWIADKVGRPVLNAFLKQGGRALSTIAEWLSAEGVLAAAGIAAAALTISLGMVAGLEWVLQDARRKGLMGAMATNYASAYIATVFGETLNFTAYGPPDQLEQMRQLMAAAQKDAISDAKEYVKKVNPTANVTLAQTLSAWKGVWVTASNGDVATAKWKLRQSLEEKAKKLAGLS